MKNEKDVIVNLWKDSRGLRLTATSYSKDKPLSVVLEAKAVSRGIFPFLFISLMIKINTNRIKPCLTY